MWEALVGFSTSDRVVGAGALVEDDDPVVKGREHLFKRLGPAPEGVVEQATAAPNELRDSARGRRVRTMTADPVVDEP